MGAKEMIDSAVAHLHTSASARTVYGEPVTVDGKTIIPVARVAYGFGGGVGTKSSTATDEAPGGAGGAMSAKPVGVVEITSQETKFVPFGHKKRLAFLTLIGSAVGLGVGFMAGRKRG